MLLSTHKDWDKFWDNGFNPQPDNYDHTANEARYGPANTKIQPRHSLCHIRDKSQLIIGRQYHIYRAGFMGVTRITGEFVYYDKFFGKISFRFQDFSTEGIDCGYLGLEKGSDNKWFNWIWVESLNLWQKLFIPFK
jgi:hypothetical protein